MYSLGIRRSYLEVNCTGFGRHPNRSTADHLTIRLDRPLGGAVDVYELTREFVATIESRIVTRGQPDPGYKQLSPVLKTWE